MGGWGGGEGLVGPIACHFSPQTKIVAQVFMTQNCVIRNKTDFATKLRKLQQNREKLRLNSMVCDKTEKYISI